MSGRHSTFYELREALGRPGCALCRLAARSVRRYLEALSFESVNDYGLRAQLRRSRGMCNLHAWQLLDDVRDPFGTAIIHRDVLNECARLLAAGQADALASRGTCLGCVARDESVGRYGDALVEHAGQSEIAALLADSGGLCQAHLTAVVSRSDRDLVPLVEAERRALRRAREGRVVARTPSPASAGVRAGNAAPRPDESERPSDPVVAAVVGLPTVRGLAIDDLAGPVSAEATPLTRAASPRSTCSTDCPLIRPAVSATATDSRSLATRSDEWDECAVCRDARAAAEASAVDLAAGASGRPELCGPHAWLAVDRAGIEAVRHYLEPSLERLDEGLAAAQDVMVRSAPLGVGFLRLLTPAARKRRVAVAATLAPPPGCAACQAQADAEAVALTSHAGEPLCRPHRLAGGSATAASDVATLAHWRAIVAGLDEYIRKNDYRFRDEPRGDEQRAPWRAVSMVVGGRQIR